MQPEVVAYRVSLARRQGEDPLRFLESAQQRWHGTGGVRGKVNVRIEPQTHLLENSVLHLEDRAHTLIGARAEDRRIFLTECPQRRWVQFPQAIDDVRPPQDGRFAAVGASTAAPEEQDPGGVLMAGRSV